MPVWISIAHILFGNIITAILVFAVITYFDFALEFGLMILIVANVSVLMEGKD